MLHFKGMAVNCPFKPLVYFVTKETKNEAEHHHNYKELVYCEEPVSVEINTSSVYKRIEGLAVDALSGIIALFTFFGAL